MIEEVREYASRSDYSHWPGWKRVSEMTDEEILKIVGRCRSGKGAIDKLWGLVNPWNVDEYLPGRMTPERAGSVRLQLAQVTSRIEVADWFGWDWLVGRQNALRRELEKLESAGL